MKNIFIIALIVVVVGLVGYGVYQSNTSTQNTNETHMEDDSMMEDNKMEDDSMMEDDGMEKDDSMMEDDKMMEDTSMTDDKMMAKGGEYVDYNPELLARANSGDVVLFFHAKWCPTCKALERSILNGDIPENLTILKIDYDTASELKDKYDIVIQHTLIQVDSQGNEITKWVGGNDLESIKNKLQ